MAKMGEAVKGERRREITEGKKVGFRLEKPPSASGLDRIDG